jgi:hypothetical protein
MLGMLENPRKCKKYQVLKYIVLCKQILIKLKGYSFNKPFWNLKPMGACK